MLSTAHFNGAQGTIYISRIALCIAGPAGTDRMHGLRKLLVVTITAFASVACSFAQTTAGPQPQKLAETQSQEQNAPYNPALAQHDLDVGKFYQKRGDLDGAIARYKDALRYKPNFAEPCQLLGQAYEQKRDFATAIGYYQEYVKILPNTPESKKLGKRIVELQGKIKKNESAPNNTARTNR